MASFLQLISKGKPVFEVAIDSGSVTTAPSSVPSLIAVDRLVLCDPDTGDVLLTFSIFGGSLNSHGSWQQLDFTTRCFLLPSDVDTVAPVHIELGLAGSVVNLQEFTFFGVDPADTSPQLPVPLAGLGQFIFLPALKDIQVLSFGTPAVFSKLGIVTNPSDTGGTAFPHTLASVPSATGTEFWVNLALSAENQNLAPFKINFDPSHYNELKDPTLGDLPSLLFSQRESLPSADENFWIVGVDHLPVRLIFDQWNRNLAAPYLIGLNTVRSGVPASFLPTFATAAPADGLQKAFHATFTLADGSQQPRPTMVLREEASPLKAGAVSVIARTVSLNGTAQLNCLATFPNVQCQDGSFLQAPCLLTAPPPPPATQAEAMRPTTTGFYFTVQQQVVKFDPKATTQHVRMGALDLLFPNTSSSNAIAGDARLVRGAFRTQRTNGDDVPWLPRVNELSLKLAVARLEVGGQDDVPGSEYALPNQPYSGGAANGYVRETPLQIPLSDFPSPSDYYFLDIKETCYDQSSQTLTLRIEQQQLPSASAVDAPVQVLVFDAEPFLISCVQVPNYLQALSAALTNQIASWDNSAVDTGWQISAGTQTFQLSLPPQGVTEAMHKQIGAGDITPGQPADFRFTSPAQLSLQASPLPQRYVEVPWNLRRILGYAGQTSPGAVLSGATFELLYGMSATLKAKPGLMIAEIGARLGNLAAPPPAAISWQYSSAQETSYESYTSFWSRILPLINSRLAVLEPWTASQPSGLSLTEADNLTFNLRPEADLANPIANPSPLPPGVTPPSTPTGTLKGSFPWAFDSERIYESLWTNPESVSCELSGLEFSALGGWGDLTARFAKGKTSIIASVRMGRVQKVTIEQIGRIGNFWNRAKLVITYERTVAPTAQFAAVQDPFLGNPILRKTAEYVQLLEKKRDTATTDITGAFSACEFPEGDPPKIPVDSSWGEDVGEHGYRIPLWRPGAVPTDVYKKPLVRLYFQASVASGITSADLYDPEKLYFYTNTDPSLDSNTDAWPKELGVDYGYVTQTAMQAPVDPASIAKSANGDVSKFHVDEEPWTQPILGPFTYHLRPSSLTPNITAGVSSTPIGAALRTITIMRGLDASAVLDTTKPTHAAYQQALVIPDHVSNILRPLISVIPSNASVGDLQAKWDEWSQKAHDRAGALSAALGNFSGSMPTAIQQLCTVFANQIAKQFGFLRTQIENEVAGLLNGIHGYLVPTNPPADFTSLRNDWTNTVYPGVQSGLRYTGSRINSLANALQAEVDPVFVQTEAQLTTLSNRLGALNGTGSGALAQAITAVETAATAIDSPLAAADAVVANLLDPITSGQLDQVRQTIADIRSGAAGVASAALADMGATGADAVATITKAKKAVDDLNTTVTTKKQAVDTAITNLQAAAGHLTTTLETQLSSLNDKLLKATDWNSFKTNANAELTAISTNIQAAVQQHLAELGNNITQYANIICNQMLQTALNDLLTGMQNLISPDAVKRFLDGMKTGLTDGAKAAQDVEDYLHGLEASARTFIGSVLPALPPLPAGSLPAPLSDAAMFLLRGFGDVPKVPQLTFPNPFSAFRFAGLQPGSNNLLNLVQLPKINLTPLIGLANTIGDTVNAISLGLPSCNLGDALEPFNLSNFNLSSFLPNIGGLELTNLFSGLRLPFDLPSDPSLGQYVQVTHGEDPQSRSAWLNMAMNFEIDDAEMFSYFGVTLVLVKATFSANAKVSAQVGQPVSRSMSGSVMGNWSLTIGGMDVVILEQCTLTFDQSGHFGFDVTPAKVKPQGILNFLSAIISDFFSGDGLTTTVDASGVQTLLELPLPDVQSGTFGIANLRLLARFGITFPPSFTIQLGFGLATLEQPFTLTVFILGGAGYLSLDASYQVDKGIINTNFQIGIFASASLAVSLGPVSGGVYAYFGITVQYQARTGNAPDLQIALVLMFTGQVTLLGFLSVSLMLSLSGNYDSSSHKLTGTGTVSYSISIGPFFSIDVSAGVSYNYSNHPLKLGETAPSPALYDDAALEYLSMFSN